MRQAGWSPLPSSSRPSYATLAYAAAMFAEVERLPGWQDFMYRVRQMREGIVRELLDGSLDKFGKSNDDSKRAVLFFLDAQLSYVPSLLADFEKARKIKDDLDKKAQLRDITSSTFDVSPFLE